MPAIEYAALLTHEVYHAHLHALGDHAGREATERKCAEYQYEVLSKLGADLKKYETIDDLMRTRWWEQDDCFW